MLPKAGEVYVDRRKGRPDREPVTVVNVMVLVRYEGDDGFNETEGPEEMLLPLDVFDALYKPEPFTEKLGDEFTRLSNQMARRGL